ncbi:MAG: hypothetical protein ACI9IP_003335 [Arcticibacterium sp.]|jgi:hypothetical protein
MKTYVKLLVLFLFTSLSLSAQVSIFGQIVKLDINQIKNTISSEGVPNASFTLNLPMPDGSFQSFNVRNSNIMADQPADIQTIAGTSADSKAQVRIAITSNGLSGIMHYANGYYIIEVVDKKEGIYTIYNMNDSGLGNCGTNDADKKPLVNAQGKVLSTGLFPVGTELRTYKFAGAATGEMTDSLGTKTLARNKIVEIMNATNLIYELEAAVSFEVITKTTDSTLIFDDGTTDPFNVNTSFGSANDTQAGFNSMNTSGLLSYGEYDTGHTFHVYSSGGGARGTGGGSPCVDGSKSVGWTEFGQNTSLGTIVGLFAHEVGHQFGMGHTYNATGGSDTSPTFCTGGWSSLASVEPGSGTTLMGYGGNCSNSTNGALSSYVLTSPNRESYFNAKSLDQMFTKMAGVSNCFTNTDTGNSVPVASVGSAVTIPKGTPFTLMGSATDADASDVLSFNWSQIDVAVSDDQGALGTINGIGAYSAVNSITAPLFRSRIGSSSSRTFPAMNFILNNANVPADNEGEALPQVARTMNFRLTVRDNKVGGGGVDSDLKVVTVDNSGPFQISSQNGPTLWFVEESKAITWDVNGTDNAPINCSNVNILISTDGGTTFSSLLTNTANDGTETITVPNTPSSLVRVKIEAVGNIFFDINNTNITISSSGECFAEVSQIENASSVSELEGSVGLNLSLNAFGSAISNFSGSIETSDPSSNLSLDNAGSCDGPFQGNRYDLYSFYVSTSATYTFNITGTYGNLLNLYNANYNPSNVCDNWLGSTGENGGSVALNGSMSKTLNSGTYYLVVSSFSSSTPTLPANYSVAISGGTVFSAVPDASSVYAYTYMIYNTVSSKVTGFAEGPDLRTYAAGNYEVYGLSYAGGLDLSPYIGSSLSEIQTAISNSSLCAVLSTNSKTVRNDCQSIPANPTVNGVTIKVGEMATLTATGCTGTVQWYQTAISSSTLGTGSSYQTPALQSNTSYFASCLDDCESARVQVDVTVCAAETSVLADVTSLSLGEGSSALDINLRAFDSTITSMSGNIDASDGTTNLTVRTSTNTCRFFTNPPQYDVYSFIAGSDATYTFTSSGSLSSRMMSLYQDSYSNASPCGNWLNSSGLYNGSNISNSSSISQALEAGRTYFIKMSGFDGGETGAYTITPSGGALYAKKIPADGSPYAYTYVIYNTVSSMVTGFAEGPDLRTYAAGNYEVYGLSYAGGLDLNPYIGSSLSEIQTAISNSSLCAVLSTNSKTVTINPCQSIPANPTVNGVTIELGEMATLTATGCTGTVQWYQTAISSSTLGTGPSYQTPALQSNTSYFASCLDVCESAKVQVDVTVLSYCALTLDCSDGDYISNVTIMSGANTLLNQSSLCTNSGFTYYTAAPPVLTQGESYTFNISKNTTWTDAIKVWVDFDKDFVFQVDEEIIAFAPNGNAMQSNTFMVPADAKVGSLRMRVKLQYSADVVDPCALENGSDGYGEIEDYLITMASSNNCLNEITLLSTANDITSGPSQTFQTSNAVAPGLITAINDITGGNVTYDAGNKVELNPGFSVNANPGNTAVFLAKIGGCN